MSDDDGRVTDADREWTRKGCWEDDSERSAEGEEEAADSCELAPHSAMSVGAGRVDSPSPQDIRLLNDLVEDLSKEQEEKDKPRAEQVSHYRKWCRGEGKRERTLRGCARSTTSSATFAIEVRYSASLVALQRRELQVECISHSIRFHWRDALFRNFLPDSPSSRNNPRTEFSRKSGLVS